MTLLFMVCLYFCWYNFIIIYTFSRRTSVLNSWERTLVKWRACSRGCESSKVRGQLGCLQRPLHGYYCNKSVPLTKSPPDYLEKFFLGPHKGIATSTRGIFHYFPFCIFYYYYHITQLIRMDWRERRKKTTKFFFIILEL